MPNPAPKSTPARPKSDDTPKDAPVTTLAPAPAETPAETDGGPLSFSDVQGDMFGRASTATAAGSVFTDVLKRTYEEAKPKQTRVPDADSKKTIQNLRSEANRLNMGVTIRHRSADGFTTIQFMAKDKRKPST